MGPEICSKFRQAAESEKKTIFKKLFAVKVSQIQQLFYFENVLQSDLFQQLRVIWQVIAETECDMEVKLRSGKSGRQKNSLRENKTFSYC